MGRMRQAETLFTNYDAALDQELAHLQAEMAGLVLSDRSRAEIEQMPQDSIGPNSLLRRVNAVRARNMSKAAEMLALLHENPTRWEVQRETPVFADEAMLHRYRTIIEELQAIETERAALEQQLNAAQLGTNSARSSSRGPGRP
jgi:hypothetical protein